MSEARLLPRNEQLTLIVEKTENFLNFLRDAGLIAGKKAPSVPESTIAYRKVHAAYSWFEWERAVNPSNAPFNGPPVGIAAGGWPDWRALHFALVDLHSTRKNLITEWGLSSIVGAKSIRFSVEATGALGSGDKALFVSAVMDPYPGRSDEVRLEKPLDWPPPVPLEWRNKCRYALKRIKKVMQIRQELSQPLANASDRASSTIVRSGDHPDVRGGIMPNKRSRPDVIAALRTLASNVRHTASFLAAWALGEIGPAATAAVPELRKLANETPEQTIRRTATDALEKINQSG